MNTKNSMHGGFTLIELMIVIAIIGILAAVAVPQYADYMKLSKYTEVVSMTASHKSAVQLCVQDLNKLAGCSSDKYRIPPAVTTSIGYLKTLTVVDGLITATAIDEIDGKQYILDPSYDALTNTMDWEVKGSCLAAGLCKP